MNPPHAEQPRRRPNAWAWAPWTDRSGRLSWLRLIVLLALLAPALWLAGRAALGDLGPRPFTEAIHFVGRWLVYVLIAGLAVTPLRRLSGWQRLATVRRMIGLAALAYALGHFGLYVADQTFDLAKVASEIARRIYLAIGFVVIVGLAVLGATSTDAAQRRLGRRWQALHRLVYPLVGLGLVHYLMQSKLDVTEALYPLGAFLWLMGFRLLLWLRWPVSVPSLLALAAASGVATALAEAGWYAASRGLDPVMVLAGHLDLSYGATPPWWVVGGGVAIALLVAVRRSVPRPSPA